MHQLFKLQKKRKFKSILIQIHPKLTISCNFYRQNTKQSQQEFDFQDETEEISSSKFGSAQKRTIKKTPGQRTQNTFSEIMNKMKKSHAPK